MMLDAMVIDDHDNDTLDQVLPGPDLFSDGVPVVKPAAVIADSIPVFEARRVLRFDANRGLYECENLLTGKIEHVAENDI